MRRYRKLLGLTKKPPENNNNKKRTDAFCLFYQILGKPAPSHIEILNLMVYNIYLSLLNKQAFLSGMDRIINNNKKNRAK